MFIAALFTIARTEKKKIMPFETTWIELEMLTLSEVSQKKKTNTI